MKQFRLIDSFTKEQKLKVLENHGYIVSKENHVYTRSEYHNQVVADVMRIDMVYDKNCEPVIAPSYIKESDGVVDMVFESILMENLMAMLLNTK